MWSQTWSNINDLLEPFPNKPTVDITEELKKQVFFNVNNNSKQSLYEVAWRYWSMEATSHINLVKKAEKRLYGILRNS